MRLKQAVSLTKVRLSVIAFFSVLSLLAAPSCSFSQASSKPAQDSAATQGLPSTEATQAASGTAAVAVQPRLQSPIHVVPFREPETVVTPKLNFFPVGAHADYFGGPVISNVHVVLVLYGTGAYLPNIAGTVTPSMANFYRDITQSSFFDMLSEYSTTGVKAFDGTAGTNQFIGHGFFDGQFTITPALANNGATITDNQIQAELLSQVTAGNLPGPVFDAQGNVNTLYMIFFPPGKTITDGTSSSCVRGGFCAYHNSTNGVFGGHRLFYGVMPDLQPPSGCSTGCGSGTTFDMATNVTSHELSEATTDADVGPATTFARPLAWIDQTNGEIGDICVAQEANVVANGTTYTVQQEFSNLQNDCVSAPPRYLFSITQAVTAGSAFGLTLTVNNSNTLNPIHGYTGTVHFTSSDANAVLPADYTFTTADAGTHNFIANLNTGGSQTITVTDTQFPGFAGNTTVQVSVNSTNSLLLALPANATTGTASTFVVKAVDVLNVVSTGYTGTVHFTSTDASAVLPANATLTSGVGTFTATFNAAGTQTLTVTDVTTPLLVRSGQVTVALPAANPTTATLTASPNPTTFGQGVTLTMNVAGTGVSALGANFNMTLDGIEFSSGLTTGTTVVTASPSGGRKTVFANYFGDSTRAASSSAPLTLQVNPASFVLTLSSVASSVPAGTGVTLHPAFNGPVSSLGSFTFFDGATPLGVTAPNNGDLVLSGLSVGSHSITVSYSGSTDILATTSAPFVLTVTTPPAPDYSISSTQSSATLLAGQSTNITISTKSLNGFFGTVKYSCGTLPALVTCTFVPASVSVTPSSPSVSTVLTVKTTGPHAALIAPQSNRSTYAGLWAFSPFALGMVLLGARKRKIAHASVLSSLLVLAMVAGLASCGGGGSANTQSSTTPAVTPAGTTAITVTGTGTAITGANPANPTQQVTINLTVQP